MPNTDYWNQLTPEQQERLNDMRHQFMDRLTHEVHMLAEAIETAFPGWTLASTDIMGIDLAQKEPTES